MKEYVLTHVYHRADKLLTLEDDELLMGFQQVSSTSGCVYQVYIATPVVDNDPSAEDDVDKAVRQRVQERYGLNFPRKDK